MEDLQKAFLQVRIRENEGDALQFHWKSDEHSELEMLQFTRALLRLAPCPFLLGGVIEHHLDSCQSRMPEIVAEIRKSLYMDNLISGSTTISLACAASKLNTGIVRLRISARFHAQTPSCPVIGHCPFRPHVQTPSCLA